MSNEINKITGTAATETLLGTSMGDRIIPMGGSDTVFGGSGDDQINGYLVDPSDPGGGFYMWDAANPLLIYGETGNDFVVGGGDADTIYGGEGKDILHGLEGNDKVYGEDGNDIIYGYDGDDTLIGGVGNDVLNGNSGNDTLQGNEGYDELNGGLGNDTYTLQDPNFFIYDTGGKDTANIYVSFVKIPSSIENKNYLEGALPLPYWIDGLIGSEVNGSEYKELLGDSKTYKYIFPEAPPNYLTDEDKQGFKALSNQQKENVLTLLNYIEGIIDIEFELTTDAQQQSTILIALNDQEDSAGYALLPYNNKYSTQPYRDSDVFLNNSYHNATLKPGSYGASTLTHEIGHALGLKHPHDDGLDDPPYLIGDEDNRRWTMMSYEDRASFKVLEFSPLDIAALQYLYGVNPNSRSGDDVYHYSPDQANFIWDGSGTDTIDASSSTQKVTIYLEPGYWGYRGDAKANKITSAGQITVNFGTVIENLIGSRYDDKLVGNSADNNISGGLGDDVLYGGDGNDKFDRKSKFGDDIFYGGKGWDTYYFTTSYDGGTDTIVEEFTIAEGGGFDKVYVDSTFSLEGIANVEDLFSYANVSTDMSLTGNELNNFIAPSDGNCVIDGKAGVDSVIYYEAQDEYIVFMDSDILKIIKSSGSIDSLFNCENIRFSDATVKISDLKLEPIITEFSPTKNATNVKLSSNIVLVFSSAISLGAGQIKLQKIGSGSGETIVYDAATSTELSVDGKTLTIDPAENLDGLSTYGVSFDVGSIVDANNNKFQQKDLYMFKTEAGIALDLVGSSTANEVRSSNEITLHFTKPFAAGQGLITVTYSSTNAVTEFNPINSPNIIIENKSLTILLPSALSDNTAFLVDLKPDSLIDPSKIKFPGAKVFFGSSGDDTISISGGNKIITGGEGNDTVTLEDDLGDYLVSKKPETGLVLITDKLGNEVGLLSSDIETVSFKDASVEAADIAYWGEFSEVPEDSVAPVYRFYNTRDNAFFYTNNADEKELVIANSSIDKNNVDEWPYVYQGATFEVAHSYQNSSQITPLYRFYNYETGHHFFTVSNEEAEFIKGKIVSGEWPFNYEGTIFNVYANDPNPFSEGEEIAVHRFYSPELNRHFYTADESEVESIQLIGQWNYEGIGFWGELLG